MYRHFRILTVLAGMKIKILLILFFSSFLLQVSLVAQHDSTYHVFQRVKNLRYNELQKQKAHLDSLYHAVSVDSSFRQVVAFPAHFQDQYRTDEEFNYERDKTDTTFWKRLMAKVERLLRKLLGLTPDYHMSEYGPLIIKIIAGIVLLVAIYFIFRLVMNHSGAWVFQKKNGEIIIDINNTEQLIEEADFTQLIAEYERMGDTRQSIRLHYLWLLKDLKQRGVIDWHPEKTNADYLYEMKEDELCQEFSYLSYLFNYIWYGEFSINNDEYQSAKAAFVAYMRKGVIYG
jgi:hypothetical protein